MERNNLIKKGVVFAVILLFFSVSVIPSTGTTGVKQITLPISNGNILYVGGSGPNNYTKIQDAIDDASDGDTVYVYDDSSPYYENVIVDKSINLIGEDRDTTIIDHYKGCIVKVFADNVNISGFTIKGIACVKLLEGSSNCIISGNIIHDNNFGLSWPIELHESHYNIISGNDISNNDRIEYSAVFVGYSYGNIISGNNITNNAGHGILLVDSRNTTISGNNISNNRRDGISHYPSGIFINSLGTIISDNIICSNLAGISINGIIGIANCIISGNDISNNGCGIFCKGLRRNKITDNIISNNGEGICLMSSDNIIEGNNIANNQLGIDICSGFNTVFRLNIVKENNFIENERSVSYDSFTNRWIRNYWDDWGSPSPRPIKGDCTFWFLSILLDIIFDENIYISIPWVQYDWHPAQEPYDIGV